MQPANPFYGMICRMTNKLELVSRSSTDAKNPAWLHPRQRLFEFCPHTSVLTHFYCYGKRIIPQFFHIPTFMTEEQLHLLLLSAWIQFKNCSQGRPQSSARGCTCTPLDFGFQLFLQNNMQSLTQRHHQTLSYRVKVKYDSRCWYSTSRHALYRYALLPLTSLWICTPTGKIQWAPMTLPRLFKVFLGLASCHYCKLIIRPFYNLSIDIGQGRPHVFCFSWHSIV